MDPWCCDTYEEALVYFRDPGTILCGKCSDTEGINSIPVWGIPNINMRFKANRLHRVTEIILRFWGKFHLDSREISLRSSSYQDEVSGRSRIYMEISSLYCLRCNSAILIRIFTVGYLELDNGIVNPYNTLIIIKLWVKRVQNWNIFIHLY